MCVCLGKPLNVKSTTQFNQNKQKVALSVFFINYYFILLIFINIYYYYYHHYYFIYFILGKRFWALLTRLKEPDQSETCITSVTKQSNKVLSQIWFSKT